MTDPRSTDSDDAFFEALAGRGSPDPGAHALRKALLDEARCIEDVLANASTQATPEQLAQRERIKAMLIAEGVFNPAAASPAAAPHPQRAEGEPERSTARGSSRPVSRPVESIVSRLSAWLKTLSSPQMVGVAASMLLGVLVVLNLSSTKDLPGEDDVMRGAPSLSVSVADPETFSAQLADRINALGGEAVLVQINANKWSVSVSVNKPESLKAVGAYLRENGFAVSDTPPYELSVTKKP